MRQRAVIDKGLIVALAFGLALVVPTGASFGQSPLADDSTNDPVWTQKPVRVDRKKQNYQRLPAKIMIVERQTVIDVPRRVVVVDSASFAFDGIRYQIANIKPIALKRICRGGDGHRWTCGRQGALFLGKLVRGKRMFCEITAAAGPAKVIGCTVGIHDLAGEIVTNGYGQASGDAALIDLQAKAIAKKSGIWDNPACVSNFEAC